MVSIRYLSEQIEAGNTSLAKELVAETYKEVMLMALLKVAVNVRMGYTAEAAIMDAAQLVLEDGHEKT